MKYLFWPFFFILSACAPLAPTNPPMMPVPSATNLAAWSMPTHPAKPTAVATPPGAEGCLSLSPVEQIASQGLLLLENQELGDDGRLLSGFFAMEMSTKAVQTLTNNIVVGSAASPDHLHFAYFEVLPASSGMSAPRALVIADANGTVQTISEEPGWGRFLGWGANGAIVFSMFPQSLAQDTSREPVNLLILYPLENNQIKKILTNSFERYPTGDELGQIVPWWRGWNGTSYNTSFDRVITPYQLPGEDKIKIVTYAMWKMPGKTLMRSFEDVYASPLGMNHYPDPVWSPDGSQFIFFVTQRQEQDAFLVQKDGSMTSFVVKQPVFEQEFSWSPNGKMVAAFSPLAGKSTGYLSVLNIETKTWQNFCFGVTYGDSISYEYGKSEPFAPIWSPDSSQLIVVDWPKKDNLRLFLIDLPHRSFSLLAENVLPTGWLPAPSR